MIFDGKKIIFVGPLGNPDDNIVQQYDYVVRTNNFFSINPKILKSTRCDILIVNNIYSKNYCSILLKNINKVKYILAKNKMTYEELKKNIDKKYHDKLLYISYLYDKRTFSIKKQPLLVTIFILYITQYFRPALLYFTGFDFYKSNNVGKFWLPGYENKHSLRFNVLNGDRNVHDIQSNIDFFKKSMETYPWIKCDVEIYNICKNN